MIAPLRRPGRDLVEGEQGVGAGIDPSRAEEMVDKFREVVIALDDG